MNRVFILGAGFSKAINPLMPTLYQLTDSVKEAFHGRGIDISDDLAGFGNDLERWLSSLADPGPWLTVAEKMRNRAQFIEVSDDIAQSITALELRVAHNAAPSWLGPLVQYWDRTESTVITFNYDRLVELAYLQSADKQDKWPGELYSIPVTPAALRVSAVVGGDRRPTLKLLKLHGSVSWWYSGPEGGEFDVIYEASWHGSFNEGISNMWEEVETYVSDKLPLLIPPAATKTPFYSNRLLATQWQIAAQALREAEELVIMGYSAPPTDLAVTNLISSNFRGEAIIPVDISDTVLARASNLVNRNISTQIITDFIGQDAIEKWVNTFGGS
ncbi:SIR2 family protein [Streptomyces sp. NBC_01390]|uniref:hypothetical protein n=1 Tax=Streptomyces sp. NBC_01390 TaxID=2903850 RepID=UPI003254126F